MWGRYAANVFRREQGRYRVTATRPGLPVRSWQRKIQLTWNVQHMANLNKRTHFATLCLRLSLMPPQIVTPDLLVEADE